MVGLVIGSLSEWCLRRTGLAPLLRLSWFTGLMGLVELLAVGILRLSELLSRLAIRSLAVGCLLAKLLRLAGALTVWLLPVGRLVLTELRVLRVRLAALCKLLPRLPRLPVGCLTLPELLTLARLAVRGVRVAALLRATLLPREKEDDGADEDKCTHTNEDEAPDGHAIGGGL